MLRTFALPLVALCLAVSGAAHADEPAPAISVHGGVGYGMLIEPSLHLQVEGSFWFFEGEVAAGFGIWGFTSLALLRFGLMADLPLHPYLSAGAGAVSAYDLDNLSGNGPGVSFEFGLLLGKDRPWGRIVPFVQVDRALWSVNPPGPTHWAPGWGFPLFGVKFLY